MAFNSFGLDYSHSCFYFMPCKKQLSQIPTGQPHFLTHIRSVGQINELNGFASSLRKNQTKKMFIIICMFQILLRINVRRGYFTCKFLNFKRLRFSCTSQEIQVDGGFSFLIVDIKSSYKRSSGRK